MKSSLKYLATLLSFGLVEVWNPQAQAETFSIENILVHDQPKFLTEGIKIDKAFVPQIEVEVQVAKDALSKNLVAEAYYFDNSGTLIQNYPAPSVADHKISDPLSSQRSYDWPMTLPQGKTEKIYFPLPDKLPDAWSVLVVFGNAKGAVAASYPPGQEQALNYPERDLVARTVLSPNVEIDNTGQSAPLIEQVVQSENPAYPAFTLIMHLPHGVTDPKKVKGVLTTCLLANSVAQIRDTLSAIKPQGDPNPYFAFAEEHQLAIIAWGSRWVWSSYANFDELDKDENRSWDDNFQQLADAWDHGIDLLVHTYGIPDHDYLMYGLCAGGEWVHRLALHKPERFLAVQMHISTSYDAPTPEASRVMWLLTTGELDYGCDRARRFYAAARELNYPIVFKAEIGLGHADSPQADQLGIRFFEYALAVKAKRDAANAGDLTGSQSLDLSAFNDSPFYGDSMNQEMFPARDKNMIPGGFLVPLPNRDIAEAWNQ
jgi:hypothetical protein